MGVGRGNWVRTGLQLGHAGEGVEIIGKQMLAIIQPELQLGHAGEGVEMPSGLA